MLKACCAQKTVAPSCLDILDENGHVMLMTVICNEVVCVGLIFIYENYFPLVCRILNLYVDAQFTFTIIISSKNK